MACEQFETPATLDGGAAVIGFICGPGRRQRRPPAEPASTSSSSPAPRPGIWLVLAACPECRPSKYCWQHWPETGAERARRILKRRTPRDAA